ncbi:MAG: hypothetical protein ACI8ZQ_001261, partial [Bacteroidia bacterium]
VLVVVLLAYVYIRFLKRSAKVVLKYKFTRPDLK